MKHKFDLKQIAKLINSTLRQDTPEDYDRLLAQRRKVDPDAIDVHLVWEALEPGSLRIEATESLEDGTYEVSFTCEIHAETEFEDTTSNYECSGKLIVDAFGGLKSIRWERSERKPLPYLEDERDWRNNAKEKEEILDETKMERVVDPQTGRDITGEYVERRLEELEKIANEIIKRTVDEYRKYPNKKKEIYEKAYWEINEKLGMGSIGPATAAAGPLIEEKLKVLAQALDIGEEERM